MKIVYPPDELALRRRKRRGRMVFVVTADLSQIIHTLVEADSPQEAMEIASARRLRADINEGFVRRDHAEITPYLAEMSFFRRE